MYWGEGDPHLLLLWFVATDFFLVCPFNFTALLVYYISHRCIRISALHQFVVGFPSSGFVISSLYLSSFDRNFGKFNLINNLLQQHTDCCSFFSDVALTHFHSCMQKKNRTNQSINKSMKSNVKGEYLAKVDYFMISNRTWVGIGFVCISQQAVSAACLHNIIILIIIIVIIIIA